MKIEINKKQYNIIIRVLEIAGSIYGVMGDMVDEKYKKPSKDVDDLEEDLFKYAEDYDSLDLFEYYKDKRIISEDYTEEILNDIFDYDEYVFWEKLVEKLARKEIMEKYPEGKIKNMSNEEFYVLRNSTEEKYWQIVEKSCIKNFELKK